MIYEEPKFYLTAMYEDIIATSEQADDGLIDGGEGEGEGSDYNGWGF